MNQVLVVVDMQNDFITGSLGSKEAQSIVSAVAEKVNYCFDSGGIVIFTQDIHDDHYLQTQEGIKLPVKHCIAGDIGSEICPELQYFAKRSILYKKNTFGSLALAYGLMRSNLCKKIDLVELCGLCTDVCVIANAMLIKAAIPEALVFVDARYCAGTSTEAHVNALNAMRNCQIEIIGMPYC